VPHGPDQPETTGPNQELLAARREAVNNMLNAYGIMTARYAPEDHPMMPFLLRLTADREADAWETAVALTRAYEGGSQDDVLRELEHRQQEYGHAE